MKQQPQSCRRRGDRTTRVTQVHATSERLWGRLGDLLDQDISCREIARMLNGSYSTVRRLLSKC
jgi:DNA-binding CsgD family transcriptional regulator